MSDNDKIDVEVIHLYRKVDGFMEVHLSDNVGGEYPMNVDKALEVEEPYIAEQVCKGNLVPLELYCKLNGFILKAVTPNDEWSPTKIEEE